VGFTFEHTFTIKEGDFRQLWQVMNPRRHPLVRLALGVVGVVCLLSSWTFVLGIVILLILVLRMAVPSFLDFGYAAQFKTSPHLHGPVTYGVSDSALWVSGESFEARCRWTNLMMWRIRKDWLVLAPSGMTCLYFSVSQLKEADVLEPVMALARAHATYHNPK
jgi:hypothetical protein